MTRSRNRLAGWPDGSRRVHRLQLDTYEIHHSLVANGYQEVVDAAARHGDLGHDMEHVPGFVGRQQVQAVDENLDCDREDETDRSSWAVCHGRGLPCMCQSKSPVGSCVPLCTCPSETGKSGPSLWQPNQDRETLSRQKSSNTSVTAAFASVLQPAGRSSRRRLFPRTCGLGGSQRAWSCRFRKMDRAQGRRGARSQVSAPCTGPPGTARSGLCASGCPLEGCPTHPTACRRWDGT